MQRSTSINGRDNGNGNQSYASYGSGTPHSQSWNRNMMDPQMLHYSQQHQLGNIRSPTSTFAQQHSPTSMRSPMRRPSNLQVFPVVKKEPNERSNAYGDYSADPSSLSGMLSPHSDSPSVANEDEIPTSAKSPYGISPSDQDLYSPGPDSRGFFFDSNDIPTSPENQPLSPMDGKIPKTGTTSINIVRNNNHQNGHYHTLHNGHHMNDMTSFHSMSMPVHGVDWFGAQSASLGGESILGSTVGGHPHSLQYSQNGTATADMGLAGIFDSDEGDAAIGAGTPVLSDLSLADGSQLGQSLPAGSNLQILYEKRRRRRESHNAVERRRRDNINEKIQELSTLLPDCLVDSTNKPNKGVILRKSVDYIRQLQQLVQQQGHRNQELEHILTTRGLANPTSNGMQMHNGNGVPMGGISAAFQTQNQNKLAGGIGIAFAQMDGKHNTNGASTVSFTGGNC